MVSFEASLPTNVSLPISEQHTGKQDCNVNEKYIQSIIKWKCFGNGSSREPESGFLWHLHLAILSPILRTIYVSEMKDLPFNEDTIISV